MRTILLTMTLAAFALAQTPLTNEEKLALENASLKLQLIEAQKKDIQADAQKVFESACKRAGIDLAACQFDQQTASVKKAEAPKPEVKK
jgi:peroxiredoxin family protein